MRSISTNPELKFSKRALAFQHVLGLYYRAELAEALLSEKLPDRVLYPSDYKEHFGRKLPSSVVEILLKPYAEMSQKERAKVAKRLISEDLGPVKLSPRDRQRLEKVVKPNSKEPLVNRFKLVPELREVLDVPDKIEFKKGDKELHIWLLDLIADTHPRMAMMIDADGRPDDDEPGDPDEPDDQPDDSDPDIDENDGPSGYSGLEFRVERMRCITPTFGEWRRDEINYAGIATEGPMALGTNPADASAVQISIRDAGSFAGGTINTFNPVDTMHTYALDDVVMPHLFAFHFATAEIDTTSLFPRYMDELFLSLEAEVSALVAVALTAQLTIGIGGILVGALIGGPIALLVAGLIGIIYGFLAYIWIVGTADDIFELGLMPLVLNQEALSGWPFFGNQQSVSETQQLFGDGGIYEVTYHWRLVDPVAIPPVDQD